MLNKINLNGIRLAIGIILIVSFCYIFTSIYQTEEIQTKIWPFTTANEIQTADLQSLSYVDSTKVEPLGYAIRHYKYNDGSIMIQIPQNAEYIWIELNNVQFTNTISTFSWYSDELISSESIKLTNRVNCIDIPDGSTTLYVQLNMVSDLELPILVEKVSFYDNYPVSPFLLLNTLILSFPFVFLLYIFIYQKNSLFFDRKYKWKKPVAAVFSVVFLLIYIYLYYPQHYYYDSGHYLMIADTIFTSSGVDFSLYPDSIRGYVLPFLIGLCKNALAWLVEDKFISFYITSSILYSIGLTILLPTVAEKLFQVKTTAFSCMAFSTLFTLLWGAHITYILSDLPAAILIFAGLLCLIQLEEANGIGKVSLYSCLMGAFMYMAYNTRTSYIFLLLLLPIVAVAMNWKKGIKFTIPCLAMYLMAVFVISIPQIYINHMKYDMLSPMVNTGGGGGLYRMQLQWGLSVQRYETYVGLGEARNAGVAFGDIYGDRILKEYFGGNIISIAEYIKQILLHPLEFLGLYARHFLNALNHCYPETYIEHLYDYTYFFSFISYTLWFMLPLGLIFSQKKTIVQLDNKSILYGVWNWLVKQRGIYLILIILSPCISVIGAFELRFFIIGYMLLYMYLCMGIDYSVVLPKVKKYALATLILFFVGLAICLAAWPAPSV